MLDISTRGTHRGCSHAGQDEQNQRGSHKSCPRVVQPGEEGVGEEDGDRDAAGQALQLSRGYSLDNAWINEELEYQNTSATRRKGL